MTAVDEVASHGAGAAPGRTRRPLVRVAAIGGAAAAVGVLGANATANTTLVVAVVLIFVVLPLVNSRPVIWIGLAIVVPWTSRLLTVLGSAPRFVDFLDFPIVLIAVLLAGLRYLEERRTLSAAERRIGKLVLVCAAVVLLSWAFNDIDEPQRLIAGWILALEPFLLLLAVIMAPMTLRESRIILWLTVALLGVQLLFSLFEILVLGAISDEVKGTLLATGAGHHVSAGGLCIAFFLFARLRVPRLLTVAFGGGALFVCIVADAKQVLFVLPLALLVLGLTGRRRASPASLIGSVALGGVMAGAAVYALMSYQASAVALDFVNRSTTNETGKVAVVKALWADLNDSAPGLVFGAGPGQTVSRFAFLTTPELFKEGSPVALLGLSVSRGADKYNTIAFSGAYTGESSFTSAQSSTLGVLGDYGLAGLAAVALLIGTVIRAVARGEDRRLRSSALACWALLIPLAVVFDWLEQPPFTLAVMVISGLAIRRKQSLEG
jgi:hypothetical protein